MTTAKRPRAKAGKSKPKAETTYEEDGDTLRIEEHETDEVMGTFRQPARGRSWHQREELLKEVAKLWGYQGLGTKVRGMLKGRVPAAIRRKIIEAVASHLGFQRVREEVRQLIRSAASSAIRQGVLHYEGNTAWQE